MRLTAYVSFLYLIPTVILFFPMWGTLLPLVFFGLSLLFAAFAYRYYRIVRAAWFDRYNQSGPSGLRFVIGIR